MTKNWKKFTAEKKINIFLKKTAIYLSLGLHKEHPSYRRSLQPQDMKFLWVIFVLVDPDPEH
jgi:hypothetical protein